MTDVDRGRTQKAIDLFTQENPHMSWYCDTTPEVRKAYFHRANTGEQEQD